MDELGKTNNPIWLNEIMLLQSGRIQTLIDMLYLFNVTWLYVFSLIYPLFGIIFGIILYQGSISASSKKLGRTCLILGIINLVLVIICVTIFVIIGGVLSNFIPYSI